ncbi:hypothetical protein CBR_g8206 [Chara braunii]|uniref:Uncharacterized protein n=1 Tax=Chara braunii TaxID=69332 RepID=A0A388KLI0_CHABU|nr:hypothetical protein CBR_g8206 [Chara braunii]|eukprot:GBG70905.1 hypothetical protein CBR_g8206 [Chara braunii]
MAERRRAMPRPSRTGAADLGMDLVRAGHVAGPGWSFPVREEDEGPPGAGKVGGVGGVGGGGGGETGSLSGTSFHSRSLWGVDEDEYEGQDLDWVMDEAATIGRREGGGGGGGGGREVPIKEGWPIDGYIDSGLGNKQGKAWFGSRPGTAIPSRGSVIFHGLGNVEPSSSSGDEEKMWREISSPVSRGGDSTSSLYSPERERGGGGGGEEGGGGGGRGGRGERGEIDWVASSLYTIRQIRQKWLVRRDSESSVSPLLCAPAPDADQTHRDRHYQHAATLDEIALRAGRSVQRLSVASEPARLSRVGMVDGRDLDHGDSVTTKGSGSLTAGLPAKKAPARQERRREEEEEEEEEGEEEEGEDEEGEEGREEEEEGEVMSVLEHTIRRGIVPIAPGRGAELRPGTATATVQAHKRRFSDTVLGTYGGPGSGSGRGPWSSSSGWGGGGDLGGGPMMMTRRGGGGGAGGGGGGGGGGALTIDEGRPFEGDTLDGYEWTKRDDWSTNKRKGGRRLGSGGGRASSMARPGTAVPRRWSVLYRDLGAMEPASPSQALPDLMDSDGGSPRSQPRHVGGGIEVPIISVHSGGLSDGDSDGPETGRSQPLMGEGGRGGAGGGGGEGDLLAWRGSGRQMDTSGNSSPSPKSDNYRLLDVDEVEVVRIRSHSLTATGRPTGPPRLDVDDLTSTSLLSLPSDPPQDEDGRWSSSPAVGTGSHSQTMVDDTSLLPVGSASIYDSSSSDEMSPSEHGESRDVDSRDADKAVAWHDRKTSADRKAEDRSAWHDRKSDTITIRVEREDSTGGQPSAYRKTPLQHLLPGNKLVHHHIKKRLQRVRKRSRDSGDEMLNSIEFHPLTAWQKTLRLKCSTSTGGVGTALPQQGTRSTLEVGDGLPHRHLWEPEVSRKSPMRSAAGMDRSESGKKDSIGRGIGKVGDEGTKGGVPDGTASKKSAKVWAKRTSPVRGWGARGEVYYGSWVTDARGQPVFKMDPPVMKGSTARIAFFRRQHMLSTALGKTGHDDASSSGGSDDVSMVPWDEDSDVVSSADRRYRRTSVNNGDRSRHPSKASKKGSRVDRHGGMKYSDDVCMASFWPFLRRALDHHSSTNEGISEVYTGGSDNVGLAKGTLNHGGRSVVRGDVGGSSEGGGVIGRIAGRSTP